VKIADHKMKINKTIIIIIGIIIIVSASYCANSVFMPKTTQSTSPGNKIQVVTSFYPLYFFAKEIGGDKTEVLNITPMGAEPHDYEPTTQDIVHIKNSSILILNGGGLESWGEKMKNTVKDKKIEIVTAIDSLNTQQVEDKSELTNDPHIWLDPILAKKVVQNILLAFVKIDPTNSALYISNEKDLQNKLDLLDQSFKFGLTDCQQKSIVTSHSAFGYIASRYGLKQVSIAGLSPDQEPSSKQMADISEFAKRNNVKYIFFETLVSPKLAETIAKEVGAKTIVFNPLEGLTPEEISSGKNYFTVQQDNLANLRIALECK
jgi:zinc transport system substrate-binding protein